MVVRARKQAEEESLNSVVKGDWCVGNKKCPSKVNETPEDERQADTIKPLFEEDSDRLIKF